MPRYLLTAGLLGLLGIAVLLWWLASSSDPRSSRVSPIPYGHDQELAGLIENIWRSRPLGHAALAEQLDTRSAVIYAAARRHGRRLAHDWAEDASASQALQQVLGKLRTAMPDERSRNDVDTLELVFAYGFRKASPDRRAWSSNVHRGVRGFEIVHPRQSERFSPTYMLSTNRDFRRQIAVFRSQYRSRFGESMQGGTYRTFEGDQWLIRLSGARGKAATALPMERGNRYVPIEEVTAHNTVELARLATDWMSNNLHDDGRMTYKYWPSVRRESNGNNMIRQWMATIALIRAARHWHDDALMARAAANIEYNLAHFYREEDGYGLIEWQAKVKLGAVALAALALAEHPARQRWQAQEAALQRTIEYLWQPDGSFRTFYKPANRNDVQNFYPGEALLYWASLYETSRDEALLGRIMASFRYYRDWHLKPKNRNPAFIPWHTQAYFKIWALTGDSALAGFIHEMNDWLVREMQQWDEGDGYRDTQGRFYNPQRPYGPPHASSTGVYLEGLIDAYVLARRSGDAEAAERYRTAIRRGLRSVMQLQFKDEVDMFYVPTALHDIVRGGIRTTVYNNEIRCDNVQHNLMGILKILAAFEEKDFLE